MSEKPNTTLNKYDGPLSGFFDAIIETGINGDAFEPSHPTPVALASLVNTKMGERGQLVGDPTLEVGKLKGDLESANGALASLNDGEEKNAKEIVKSKALLKSKKEEIAKLQSELKTAESNTQESEEKIAELETLIKKAESEQVENTSKLESLENENKEYAELISKLKSEKENLETQIAKLVAFGKNEKESGQEKLNNTVQANFVLSEMVKESQKKVDSAELTVDKWMKRVEDKNSEIATLKQEMERIKKEGEEENARLVEINEKIITSKDSLKNLLNGDLIDQDDLIDSLEDEIKKLEAEKNDIEILLTHSQYDFTLQSEELQQIIVELDEAKQTTTRLASELGEMIKQKERLEKLNQAQREKEKSQKDAIASLSHQLVGYKKTELQRKKKERQEVLNKQYEEENSAIGELLKKQDQSSFNSAQYLDDLEEFEVDTKQALSLKQEEGRKRKFEENIEKSKQSHFKRLEEQKREEKQILEFKEKIKSAKSALELFGLAKSFLNLSEGDSRVLNDQICDFVYKGIKLENDKLADTGFEEKLGGFRDEFQKKLQTLGGLQDWEEVERFLVNKLFNNIIYYSTHSGDQLFNEVCGKTKLPEPYFGKELLEKIQGYRTIFEKKNIFELRKNEIEKTLKSGDFGFLEKALLSERHFKIDQEFVTKIVGDLEGESELIQKINEYSKLQEELGMTFSITFAGKEFGSKGKLLMEMVKREVEGAKRDLNPVLDESGALNNLKSKVGRNSTMFKQIFTQTVINKMIERGEKLLEYDDVFYISNNPTQMEALMNRLYSNSTRRV